VELLAVDATSPDPTIIARAARVIQSGGLVAFPTETVYGLGANAINPDAVARIYAAKGRPSWNPVISHVARVGDARALTSHWPDAAETLANAFWPGPLTMVLPRATHVPDIATAGRDAVAVRMPSHPVALALITAAECPIAAPSANRFTQVSPTSAQHVVASLGDRVDVILDGGACTVGIESTVVDLSGETPIVLRPGMISRAAIAQVLGCDVSVLSVRGSSNMSDEPHRSPGMVDRHYAPNADVWLIDASQVPAAADALHQRRDTPRASSDTVTVLRIGAGESPFDTLPLLPEDRVVRLSTEPAAYAQQLYAELHAADARGVATVVIERPPDNDAWTAITDRLTRASR